MKKLNAILFFVVVITIISITTSSCKKETYITSADASLRLSEDTLHFDTVFTTLGSTTQYLKMFNDNNQKLKISSMKLMGGATSFFKLNVDGVAGINFTDIDIEANDSLYFFATVTINPTTANLPFVIRDSIKIEYNGNTKWLQLEAYGKNAMFMKNVTITKDSSLNSSLPIVILGSLTVNENAILTIPKYTQLFIHAAAPIIVDGTLKAIGDTGCRIVFQPLRIDEPYKNYPGGWPGIYFTSKSKNNVLEQCVIKNSYQGTVVQGASVTAKLQLNQCIFDNIYDVAVGANNANITARNCLFSNVGYGLYALSGGTYNFSNCTFASFSNYYLAHKNPLINISNTNTDNTAFAPLTVNIDNSIIYGEGGLVDDEIAITKLNTTVGFTANFKNCLYKQKSANANLHFVNSIVNQNPMFDSINLNKRYFDFKLQNNSPCIDAANSTLTYDLDKNPRPVGTKPDIGCYEKQ